jgi:hypothetical protein
VSRWRELKTEPFGALDGKNKLERSTWRTMLDDTWGWRGFLFRT